MQALLAKVGGSKGLSMHEAVEKAVELDHIFGSHACSSLLAEIVDGHVTPSTMKEAMSGPDAHISAI